MIGKLGSCHSLGYETVNKSQRKGRYKNICRNRVPSPADIHKADNYTCKHYGSYNDSPQKGLIIRKTLMTQLFRRVQLYTCTTTSVLPVKKFHEGIFSGVTGQVNPAAVINLHFIKCAGLSAVNPLSVPQDQPLV